MSVRVDLFGCMSDAELFEMFELRRCLRCRTERSRDCRQSSLCCFRSVVGCSRRSCGMFVRECGLRRLLGGRGKSEVKAPGERDYIYGG